MTSHTNEKQSGRMSSRQHNETIMAWIFSTPAIIFLVTFLVVPFFMAFWLSFTDQRLIPNPRLPTRFIGFRNFSRLLTDKDFFQAIFNNFYFVVIVVPIQTSLALLLAILVNQKIRAVNLFRTIYFSPVVVTMVVVSIIWKFMYNPGEGMINAFIQWISFGHLSPYNWLDDPVLALPAIMVLSIWQGVGFQMIIYLAGLQEIPGSLYEAANIDGANPLQQFFHITIPQLRNTTIFVMMTTTILAFRLFTQVYTMQGIGGHPQGTTRTMMLYTFNQGFRQGKIGYASAVTVVFFLIVLAASMIQRVFLREEREVQ
ncbi:MAG: sugar ABC transporter permease [Candidatus Vecturithrix sp.]|nr:sugar ABC transporter permease [Candidatus Vecturithrix sp.]